MSRSYFECEYAPCFSIKYCTVFNFLVLDTLQMKGCRSESSLRRLTSQFETLETKLEYFEGDQTYANMRLSFPSHLYRWSAPAYVEEERYHDSTTTLPNEVPDSPGIPISTTPSFPNFQARRDEEEFPCITKNIKLRRIVCYYSVRKYRHSTRSIHTFLSTFHHAPSISDNSSVRRNFWTLPPVKYLLEATTDGHKSTVLHVACLWLWRSNPPWNERVSQGFLEWSHDHKEQSWHQTCDYSDSM